MSFNYSKLATLRPKFLDQPQNQQIDLINQEPDLKNDQADLTAFLDQEKQCDQNDQANDQQVDGHQSYLVDSKIDGGRPPNKVITPTGGRPLDGHQSYKVDGHLQENSMKVDGHQEKEIHTKFHNINKRKGDRHSTDKVKVTIRHKQDFYQKIKDFCQTKNLQLQDFYELAANQYMELVNGHQLDKVAGHQSTSLQATNKDMWPSHDDLMIFKSHDDIIMLYKNLTGRRWTAADDRVGAKFNNIDRRTIELGMIQTYIQAKGKKINSFKYFVPEIENIIDAKFDRENLNVYLKSRRKLLNDFLIKLGKEPLSYTIKDKE